MSSRDGARAAAAAAAGTAAAAGAAGGSTDYDGPIASVCYSADGSISASVEETNRIRSLLGLQPLTVAADKQTESEKRSSKNTAEKQEVQIADLLTSSSDKKPTTGEVRSRIIDAKNRRCREQLTSGQSLGDSLLFSSRSSNKNSSIRTSSGNHSKTGADSKDDSSSLSTVEAAAVWVERMRKRKGSPDSRAEEQNDRLRKTAKYAEKYERGDSISHRINEDHIDYGDDRDYDDDDDSHIYSSSSSSSSSSRRNSAIRVAHTADEFSLNPNDEIVLNLKDAPLIDETGNLNCLPDVLENAELVNQQKRLKNQLELSSEQKSVLYNPFEGDFEDEEVQLSLKSNDGKGGIRRSQIRCGDWEGAERQQQEQQLQNREMESSITLDDLVLLSSSTKKDRQNNETEFSEVSTVSGHAGVSGPGATAPAKSGTSLMSGRQRVSLTTSIGVQKDFLTPEEVQKARKQTASKIKKKRRVAADEEEDGLYGKKTEQRGNKTEHETRTGPSFPARNERIDGDGVDTHSAAAADDAAAVEDVDDAALFRKLAALRKKQPNERTSDESSKLNLNVPLYTPTILIPSSLILETINKVKEIKKAELMTDGIQSIGLVDIKQEESSGFEVTETTEFCRSLETPLDKALNLENQRVAQQKREAKRGIGVTAVSSSSSSSSGSTSESNTTAGSAGRGRERGKAAATAVVESGDGDSTAMMAAGPASSGDAAADAAAADAAAAGGAPYSNSAVVKKEEEEKGMNTMMTENALDGGIACALKLLKSRGELSDDFWRIGRHTGDNKPLHQSTSQNDIKIEHKDEFGRVLGPKDAFRYISWAFHGKGPGKKKREKLLNKIEAEKKKRLSAQNSHALPTMHALKKQQSKGSAYVILSSGSTSSLPSSSSSSLSSSSGNRK